MTHEYWMVFLKLIITRTFVPWLIYSTLSVAYFTETLDKRNKYADDGPTAIIFTMELTIILLIIYQLYIEAIQMKRNGLNYFWSIYNYIDNVQYFGTLIIVITNMAESQAISMIDKREISMYVLLS